MGLTGRAFTEEALDAILKATLEIGNEQLAVGSGAAVSLTVPTGAGFAFISVDADGTQVGLEKVIRFTYGTTDPTAILGHAVGDDNDIFVGLDNLATFKVIGVTAGKNHTLQITYFTDVKC